MTLGRVWLWGQKLSPTESWGTELKVHWWPYSRQLSCWSFSVSEISLLVNWTFKHCKISIFFLVILSSPPPPQSSIYLILIHVSIPAEFICWAATSGSHDVSRLNRKIVSVAYGTVSSRTVWMIWVYKGKENYLDISNIWRNASFKCWIVNGK